MIVSPIARLCSSPIPGIACGLCESIRASTGQRNPCWGTSALRRTAVSAEWARRCAAYVVSVVTRGLGVDVGVDRQLSSQPLLGSQAQQLVYEVRARARATA